jgi:hypothetical protein
MCTFSGRFFDIIGSNELRSRNCWFWYAFRIIAYCPAYQEEENAMVAFFYKPRKTFRVNDEVAVVRRFPWVEELITITKVVRVGDTVIETADHRLFFTSDGQSLNLRQTSYLEPLCPQHVEMDS